MKYIKTEIGSTEFNYEKFPGLYKKKFQIHIKYPVEEGDLLLTEQGTSLYVRDVEDEVVFQDLKNNDSWLEWRIVVSVDSRDATDYCPLEDLKMDTPIYIVIPSGKII